MRPSSQPGGITLTVDSRERLADMNERTKELEDASQSFAAQVRYCFVFGYNGEEGHCH